MIPQPFETDDLGNGSWPSYSPEERQRCRRAAYEHAMEHYVMPALVGPLIVLGVALAGVLLFGPFGSVGLMLFLLGIHFL